METWTIHLKFTIVKVEKTTIFKLRNGVDEIHGR